MTAFDNTLINFLKELMSIRKTRIIIYVLLLDASFYFIANSQYEVLRSFVSPFFLFLFPGIGVVLLLWKNARILELLIVSFSIGTTLNLILIANLFLVINRNQFILIIFVWTVLFLVSSLVKAIRRKERMSLDFPEAFVLLLSFGLYITLFIVFKSLHYFPTPDEATYLHYARFSPVPNIYETTGWYKAYVIGVTIPKTFWFAILSSFLLFSQSNAIMVQAVSASFMALIPVVTYLLGSRLFSNKKIGLTSAGLTAINPVLFMFGITILLEIALTFYVLSAVYFYINALKFDSSRLIKIDYAKLILSVYMLFLAYLIKFNVVVVTILFIHFILTVYKSRLKERKKILSILIGLPLAYFLLLELPLFIAKEFLHSYQLAQNFAYFMPVSIIYGVIRNIFFPSPESVAAGWLGGFWNISATYAFKGLYLTMLSPFYTTMPVLVLFLAGVMLVISKRSLNYYEKHFSRFMLAIILLDVSMLVLFRTYADWTRQGLYKWPLIMMFAAYGIFGNIKKMFKEYLVSFIVVVLAIILAEHLLTFDWGIKISIIGPAPYLKESTSLCSVLVAFFIILWKGEFFHKVFSLRIPVKSGNVISVKTASLVVSLIVVVACGSLIHFYAVNGEFRTKGKEFPIIADWLESHVSEGDLVICNAKRTLEAYLSDSTLKKINYTSLPATKKEFNYLLPHIKYLVIFPTGLAYWEAGYNYTEKYIEKDFSTYSVENATHLTFFQELFQAPSFRGNATIYETYLRRKVAIIISSCDSLKNWTWFDGDTVYINETEDNKTIRWKYTSPDSFIRFDPERTWNWSECVTLSLLILGDNSNNVIKVEIGSGGHYYGGWKVTLDFNGWKKINLPLHELDYHGPNYPNIAYIDFIYIGIVSISSTLSAMSGIGDIYVVALLE